ncbi:hypothetical protein HAP94_03330 [Acidithiobacillus ferrivorans]|jgi:hypothetical protein|nr:hypothetical protein [Acidithiobacillus ferrivorans]
MALSKTAAIKVATSKVSKVEHLGRNWVASGPDCCMELSDLQYTYRNAVWARKKWIAEIALELTGYDLRSGDEVDNEMGRKLEDLVHHHRWTVSNIVNYILS